MRIEEILKQFPESTCFTLETPPNCGLFLYPAVENYTYTKIAFENIFYDFPEKLQSKIKNELKIQIPILPKLPPLEGLEFTIKCSMEDIWGKHEKGEPDSISISFYNWRIIASAAIHTRNNRLEKLEDNLIKNVRKELPEEEKQNEIKLEILNKKYNRKGELYLVYYEVMMKQKKRIESKDYAVFPEQLKGDKK